jgi:hypothetical protein
MTLALEVHVLEGRIDHDILGGGELHSLIGLAINSICHDCGLFGSCVFGVVFFLDGRGLSMRNSDNPRQL